MRWEDIDLQHEIVVWPRAFDKQREEQSRRFRLMKQAP
jgi:hypothetical protein